MAEEKDLFAPPTEDELYGAPTEEELSAYAPMGVTECVEPESYLNRELPEAGIGGSIDAFVKQAAPAATLGLSDVVAGGAGAMGHAAANVLEKGELPSKQDLMETYYEAKGDTAQQREEAMSEHPTASIAGMVGGGMLNPIPGQALSKMGKVGGAVSKALPSFKGADKISKAGQLADKARLMGDYDRYKKLKSIQAGLATKMAVREGTKAGAISSATLGSSRLLEGDVGGFVDDVFTGGAVGAGLGYGFTKGTQLAGSLVKKIPGVMNAVDSFRLGSKGLDLNEAEVNNQINKAASKYLKDFNGRLKSLKLDKQKILDQVDELGVTINTKADLEKAKKVVMNIESAAERKKAQQFLDVLDDYLGDGKAYKQAKNQLEKKIAKARFVDPVAEARIKLEKKELKRAIENQKAPASSDDLGVISSEDILPGGGPDVKAQVKHNIFEDMTDEGMVNRHKFQAEDVTEFKPSSIQRTVDPGSNREVAFFKDFGKGKVHAIVGDEAKALNAETLTTGQANRLKNLMNKYSALAKKEDMPIEVITAATDAATMIRDKINGAARGIKAPIDRINKDISNLIDVKKRVGAPREITKLDKEDALKAMAKFVSGVGDKNPTSDTSLVLNRLRKINPEKAEEIASELEEIRRQYELTKPIESISAQGGKLAAVMGTVTGVWNKAWNILGQASSAPFRASNKAVEGTKTFLANKSLDIVEASPAQIQGVINKIGESSNKAYQLYAAPLAKALKSEPRTKQAIMYGLYQQPAFREMIDSINEEEPKGDKNE